MYCYVFSILSLLIFLYIVDLKTFIQTSTDTNLIKTNGFFKTNYFLFLGSLVGIPPLLGFFSKFFLFLTLLSFQNYLFIIIFIVLNFFLLVFYLQQVRFLQSNLKKKLFIKKKLKPNFASFFLIIGLQWVNVFSFFFLPLVFNNILFYVVL